jgi:phenylalanyl-tRNA synthetase beta chain
VAKEKLLGGMGELHPDVKDAFDLIQPVYIFEINFSLLQELTAEKRVFQPLPRFPAVFRDLSFMVEEKILAGDLVQTIWEGGQGMVKEVKIFDLYRGKPVPPGKKSLAFRIKYQHAEKTLTDEEVNELHQKIIALMKDRFGGELR